jgi:hypothetical protein
VRVTPEVDQAGKRIVEACDLVLRLRTELEALGIVRSMPGLSEDPLVYNLARIFGLAERIRGAKVYGPPEDIVNAAAEKLEDIAGILRRLPNTSDASHETMVAELHDAWRDLWITSAPLLLLNVADVEEDAKRIIQEGELLFSNKREEIDRLLTDTRSNAEATVKSIIEEAERGRANVGAIQEQVTRMLRVVTTGVGSKHFDNEAHRQQKSALLWLAGALAGGIATCIIASRTLHTIKPAELKDLTVPILLYNRVPSFVLVTTVFMGMIYALRSVSVCFHNVVVNRHRAHALATLTGLLEDTKLDTATYNALMLQGVQAIFTTQPSGYVKSEPENPPTDAFVEVIKNLAGKKE